jgi:UDP-glucose 4-epimerase
MRFLITGGAGFIGSHLAEELLMRGHRVHVLDDLSTGSIDNVRHLKTDPRFSYTIETCASASVVAELVDEADIVYHLAAAVGVELIVESPVRTIETNVHCTEVVLAQASKKRKPVFIASTSEVYGKSAAVPFREDGDLVMGPSTTGRWSYACSKAIDEFLALAYWKERKLPTVVVRLFNTVGPRQTGCYGMVVPTFVGQALAGRPLTVFGDGLQTRCFCHVGDVVQALVELMMLGDGAYGKVFNIGSQEEISILSLADRVRRLTRSESEIVVIPYAEAYEEGFEDMPRRYPDIAKIQAAVGWTPTRSLDEILGDVINFHRAEAAVV